MTKDYSYCSSVETKQLKSNASMAMRLVGNLLKISIEGLPSQTPLNLKV